MAVAAGKASHHRKWEAFLFWCSPEDKLFASPPLDTRSTPVIIPPPPNFVCSVVAWILPLGSWVPLGLFFMLDLRVTRSIPCLLRNTRLPPRSTSPFQMARFTFQMAPFHLGHIPNGGKIRRVPRHLLHALHVAGLPSVSFPADLPASLCRAFASFSIKGNMSNATAAFRLGVSWRRCNIP